MTQNKRFINDIDDGQLIDTKGELSTINYSDTLDFYELWEFLNKLNDENEQLKFRNSNLMKEVAEYSRKAKELEKRVRKTEKEKDCGTCKYFQTDGMFGIWCDKGHNWKNVEYCSDYERRFRMTENIHLNCENYNSKKDMCLKWFEENVSERYKTCREYSEFSDKELARKWSN